MNETIALTEATYYILLSLEEPRHGYGIMQEVEMMSRGRVHLAAGTLYGALTQMCDRKWIRPLPVQNGSRKKEYQITEKGLEILEEEVERLRELLENGESVLGGHHD